MADGKIFAAEFALRRNVKALDKILIEDSDDGVVKYAFPPQIAALSGYAYADSIADLPEDPVNKTIGYVVGDKFYIYVGEGGNAKDGLYQEVQGFVGPQGIPGPKGDKGDAGDGAIDEAYLANYLQQNQYQTASDVNSALAIYATQAYVTQEIDKLLGGASGAYDTLKEIEEVLKGNVDSIGDLFDVLDTKWTQDNTLIAHWNEAYSWGNHATAGYVAKTYVDSNFVTLATAQTITGEKNFTGGFKVNGGVLEYNASLGTWVLIGNLLVTGGVSMFSNIEGFTPSTITDAVLIDNDTIKRNALGELYVASDVGGGGIDEAYLAEYLTANNYAKKSDINSALTDYATQSWVTGRGYLTGITGTMVTDALEYTPLSTKGGTITGDLYIKKQGNATMIFQPNAGAKSFWFGVNSSEEWFCTNGGYTATYKLIHSGNYSDYALPLTGGKVNGQITSEGVENFVAKGTTYSLYFGIGSGQVNRGIYDLAQNKWWIVRGADATTTINASIIAEGLRINQSAFDNGLILNRTVANSGVGIVAMSNDVRLGSFGINGTKTFEIAGDNGIVAQVSTVTGEATFNGMTTIKHSGNTPLVINQTYATNNSRGVVLMNGSMVNGHMYYSHLFGKAASSKNSAYVGFYHAGASSDSNYLSMGLYGVNDVLNITAVGNVGIGTTSPSEKLHVNGNILATGGITAPTFTGVASNATYWNAPSSIRPTTANLPVVGNTTFSHFLATSSMTTGKPSNDGYIIHGEWDTVAGWSSQLFFANGSPDPNNRMQWRAMDSGTWGEWKSVAFIDTGMLKPTQGLQINHIGSNYAEGIRLANRNGISNTWSEINFGCDPSATTGTHETQWTVGRNGNNNYFVVRNFGTDYLQIDLSGNTLIKGAITMYYSSDRRLKQNIRKVDARQILMSLGGVYQYEYIPSEVEKNHIYEGTHFGLIYQNVKGTTLNKMCYEREDKMGALNYISTDFISIVAGATMENISEIEKLKRENRRLKKRVEQLEKRVA